MADFLLKQPENHNLVVVSRSKEPLEKIKSSAPDRVGVLAADLSDFSVGKQAVDLAKSMFGRIDSVILNHGILGEVKRIADCDPEGFQKTFDINYISVVACVRTAAHQESYRLIRAGESSHT